MRTPPLRRTWRLIGVLVVLLPLLLTQSPARAADEVVTDCSSDSQLRTRLAATQAGGGGTLTFNCGAGSHVIILTGGVLPAITTATTIDGGGSITISGNNATRLLMVNTGASLTLNNLTLSNALWTGGDGGAIFQAAGSTLNINNSRFTSNQSGASGGAIVSYGELIITNSEFVGNRAINGGAIYPRHGAVVMITGSTFRENEAGETGLGGAMLLWDGPRVTIRNSTLSANKADNGGAIYVTANSVLTLEQFSTLSGNVAESAGGAIFIIAGAAASLANTILSGNVAEFGSGGGVYNAGTATLTAVTLNNNQASPRGSGGGIANSGTATVSDSSLIANRARFGGGGISNSGTLTVSRTTLSGNNTLDSMSYGGGLHNSGTATMTNATVSGNSADASGGGIYNSGTATMTNGTLSGNAANTGGGIYHATSAAGQTLTLRNTIVAAGTTGSNCSQSITSTTSISSAGFNLSSDFSCTSHLNQTGDQNNRNPLLGPLASNGGPTQTQLPRPGSPAIDRGTSTSAPNVDQRGVSRPQGAAFDVGAVEVREREHFVYLPMTIR